MADVLNPFLDSSLIEMVLIFLAVPLVFILVSTPRIIGKLRENALTVRDMYKRDLPSIPTNGGLIILLVSLFSISILSLFYGRFITPLNYTIIVVVVLFAFFGLLDDMVDIGRPAKLILLFFCSYPLLPFITTSSIFFPFIGSVDFAVFYPLMITVYVLVVANLVNMHSGMNGLAPGLSLIVLAALILKALFFGTITNALFIVCLTGSLLGYFWFEKYPSRIFWGNIGALSIGAAMGAVIVTQGFIISGVIMLIPHIANFLLYVYWRLNNKRYPTQKFGSTGDDGNLIVPNPLTLKWVLPYYVKMTERAATNAMFAVTAVFCMIGFFIPG